MAPQFNLLTNEHEHGTILLMPGGKEGYISALLNKNSFLILYVRWSPDSFYNLRKVINVVNEKNN